MKLNKWLFGAAAALMLGACSDNLDGPKAPEQVEGDGQGYIGINIQLPTVSGTRANDNFEDGELSEYRVDEAALFLFQGADEASAKFQGAYQLQESEPSYVEGDDQITRQSIRVANVKGLDVNTKLFALVMVNGKDHGIYDAANPTGKWTTDMTIKDFQEKVLDNVLFEQDTKGQDFASNIFMTNSPLSTVPGGGETPGTVQGALPVLVELDPTTYKTQSEAIANPAGTIHIERSVAKVTCNDFPATTGIKVTVNDYEYTLNVASVSWDMAQDLSNTYAVRNTNRTPVVAEAGTSNLWLWNIFSQYVTKQADKYRMIGETPIYVDTDKYYRPYFCQVPGYNVPLVEKNDKNEDVNSDTYENKKFTKTTMEAEDAVDWTNRSCPGAFYPRENTFPVEYMKYANTTRIGFWVTFEFTSTDANAPKLDNGINFYVNGLDKQTLYVDVDGKDPLTNRALKELSDTEKYKALWDNISASLEHGETAGSVEGIELKDLVNFTYDEAKRAKSGEIEITSVTFKSLAEINQKYGNIFATVPTYRFNTNIAALNNLGDFKEYKLGKTFYEVRIKHFGDDNTPWDVDGSLVSATTIKDSYGDNPERRQDFLGRYGVVRNNWYEINVTNILKLGDPRDPAKWDDSWPDKPDDNKDQYIAVELRVLSWARRSQNIEF